MVYDPQSNRPPEKMVAPQLHLLKVLNGFVRDLTIIVNLIRRINSFDCGALRLSDDRWVFQILWSISLRLQILQALAHKFLRFRSLPPIDMFSG